MNLLNLKETSIQEIVHCLSASFKGYFVEMPSDVGFWETRFKNGRVDKTLSWGAFQNGNLVGFVMNGIDVDKGEKTAYNAGTGIIPTHRGQQLVDKMYDYGMPQLIANGVTKCTLEVIAENKRAIRVYERIGFNIQQTLKCYKGLLIPKNSAKIIECKIENIDCQGADKHYSWDNRIKTIKHAGSLYKTYKVSHISSTLPIGYFIINPDNGYIAQLETTDGNWELLFDGISQVQKEIRINNVLETRKDLIDHLHQIGIENTINQYEMDMKL